MRINIWKDPERNRYYFAIKYEDTMLSAVMADFHGPPDAIDFLIEVIKKGSELGENNE